MITLTLGTFIGGFVGSFLGYNLAWYCKERMLDRMAAETVKRAFAQCQEKSHQDVKDE